MTDRMLSEQLTGYLGMRNGRGATMITSQLAVHAQNRRQNG
ncbi:hypothetical protein [Phaeovulum sp.]